MSRNYRCVKFVNLSMSSFGVFSDECSTFLDMMNDIDIDKKQQLYIIKKMINIAIRATYYIFCYRNRTFDSPEFIQSQAANYYYYYYYYYYHYHPPWQVIHRAHPKSQVVTVVSFKILFRSWSIMWTIQCGYSKCLKRYVTESFQHVLVFWGCCQLVLVQRCLSETQKSWTKRAH